MVHFLGQEVVSKVGKLNGQYEVVGMGILVEHLTAKEAMGTELTLGNKSTPQYNQAYILQIGPMIKAQEWGFQVGDRVLLQGNYVPVPRAKGDDNPRQLGVIDPAGIKCVLQESFVETNE